MSFELPELDRKKTQQAVEKALADYRMFKYWILDDDVEPSIIANYEVSEGGRSNKISDQTSSIAIHNADQAEKRRKYCERIERAVARLPRMERRLIEERYMTRDSEYITDLHVYNFILEISPATYAKIRWKAFYRLALNLNLAVIKKPKREYKCNNGGEKHE